MKKLNYTLRPKGKGKQIPFFFLTKPKNTVEEIFQTRLQQWSLLALKTSEPPLMWLIIKLYLEKLCKQKVSLCQPCAGTVARYKTWNRNTTGGEATASQEEGGRIVPEGREAPPRMEQQRGAARGGRGIASLHPCRGLSPGKGEEPLTVGGWREDLVARNVPNASQHKDFELTEPF